MVARGCSRALRGKAKGIYQSRAAVAQELVEKL